MSLGIFRIDNELTFPCNTHLASSGDSTDADSAPTYKVYEGETDMSLDGVMTKYGTGFYLETITLSSANGFENGKCYNIKITATVSTVTGTITHTFQVQAEVSVPSVADIADAVWDELKSGHTTPDSFGDYLDIEVSSRLAPTTAGRTLDISAGGNAGIDWANIDSQSASASLNNTSINSASYVLGEVNANMISAGTTLSNTNFTAQGGANLVNFFENNLAATSKVVDDVGSGSSLTVQDIVDGVWDEARLDHLDADSFGEQMDWMLHKDTNRTFDRAQDSLEAIRDAMVSGGSIPSASAIADAVWDSIRNSHVAVGTFGEFFTFFTEPEYITSEDIANAVWDEPTENHIDAGTFGLLVGKMTFDENNYIYAVPQDIDPAVVDTIVDATWDELRASHVVEGSFGEGVIAYSLATQAKADVNEQADIALSDIRLDELILNVMETKPTVTSFMDAIMNKDASQTFSQTTDSLEAIRDNQFGVATIIDGTIDVQSILKRIHALVSGNGSSREGDIYTYKQHNGSNYIRQTISDTEVVTALV